MSKKKKEKKYILTVWGSSATPTKYTVKDTPMLGSHTNDIAIVFEKSDGKILLVGSRCKWTLEEQ